MLSKNFNDNEPQMQIRIKDIAKKAEVSIGTVDRVIHERGEGSVETRKKVLRILEELNYKPNILASTLASQKEHHFAVLIPESQSEEAYWSKPLTGVKKAFNDLFQYGVRIDMYHYSPNNPDSFQIKADAILRNHPEGVVMAPFFIKESKSLINELDERKIPYIFIDSNLKETNKISYIGQNSFQCGTLAARLIDLTVPGPGNILIVHFAKKMDNQNHLIQRENGFYDYFIRNDLRDQKRLVTVEVENTSEEVFYPQMNYYFERLSSVRGIFVTNSKVYLMAEYIKKRNLHRILLIGNDLIAQNVAWLKAGVVDFLICQRPEEQGYKAIESLFSYVLLKKAVAEENFTSIDIITKENIDFY